MDIKATIILVLSVHCGTCQSVSWYGNTCPLSCPRGQTLDIPRCRCLRSPQILVPIPIYPNLSCPSLYCPYALFPCKSFQSDYRGCKTCRCQCLPARCPSYCPFGTEVTYDGSACEVCRCRSAPVRHVCRSEPCGAFCPNGLAMDQYGCQICRCRSKPCGYLCRNLCPFGRVHDSEGCPTCTCKHGDPRTNYYY